MCVTLLACFGVDVLLKLGGVVFPASVACLVILFLALLLADRLFGEHRLRRVVAVLEVPVSTTDMSMEKRLLMSDRVAGRSDG